MGHEPICCTIYANRGQVVLLDGMTEDYGTAAGAQRTTVVGTEVCPFCGKRNPSDQTFKCLRCGKDFLCLVHFAKTKQCCEACAAQLEATEQHEQALRLALRKPEGRNPEEDADTHRPAPEGKRENAGETPYETGKRIVQALENRPGGKEVAKQLMYLYISVGMADREATVGLEYYACIAAAWALLEDPLSPVELNPRVVSIILKHLDMPEIRSRLLAGKRLLAGTTPKDLHGAVLDKVGPADSLTKPTNESSLASAKRLIKNSLGHTLVLVPPQNLAWQPTDSPLYVATTCVSNRDWREYVLDGGPPPPIHTLSPELRTWRGSECPQSMLDHPVVFVTHSYARAFCEWLTERERRHKQDPIGRTEKYALPTLAQWRAFAASARLTSSAVLGRTWVPGHHQPTEPVGSGEPSDLGLFHVYGNIFEWCSDEEVVRFTTPDERTLTEPCNYAVGGGWASDYDWLEQQIQKGDCGTIWGPAPWPMKDGGFRVCLLTEHGEERPEPVSRMQTVIGQRP